MGEETNPSLWGQWKERVIQDLEAAVQNVASLHRIIKSGGKENLWNEGHAFNQQLGRKIWISPTVTAFESLFASISNDKDRLFKEKD